MTRVDFHVWGGDYDDLCAKAEAQLAEFAPNVPADEWQVTVDARPNGYLVTGEISGGWKGEVWATRLEGPT